MKLLELKLPNIGKGYFKESFLVKHERKLELGNHIVKYFFLKDRIARILLTLLGGEILLFKHLKAPSCGVIIFTRLSLLLLTSQQITQAQFTCNKIFFTIRTLNYCKVANRNRNMCYSLDNQLLGGVAKWDMLLDEKGFNLGGVNIQDYTYIAWELLFSKIFCCKWTRHKLSVVM